jgi:AAA domain
MESDYGWAEKDDYPEDYMENSKTIHEIIALDNDFDEGDNENHNEDYIPIVKSHVIPKKKSSFVEGPVVRGKKRKRRQLTGPEEFFKLVLSWTIDNLLLGTRKALNLSPLADMPAHFLNQQIYFDTMRQIAIEEARATLTEGLRTINDQMELRMSDVQSCLEDSPVLLIVLKIVKGDMDLTRPGTVFKLFQDESKRNCTNSNKKNYNVNSGNSYSHSNGNGNGNGNSRSSNNFNSDNSSISNRNQNQNMDSVLAVVAQGSQAMSLVVSMGGFMSYLPLWINPFSPLAKRLISDGDSAKGSCWTALSLGSVLSYQRMATVCTESPSPPFMFKLLGHRPSSHIKFDSDSEDESNSKTGASAVLSVANIHCEKHRNNRKDENSADNSDIEVDDRSSSDNDNNNKNDDYDIDGDSGSDDDSDVADSGILPRAIMTQLSARSSNRLNSLNVSQSEALRKCLGSSITARNDGTGGSGSASTVLAVSDGNLHLILGPPGCGKTHFLVATLHALIAKGNQRCDGSYERIMVCAPSNKAVCVVLEQFLQSGVVGAEGDQSRCVRCCLVGVMDKLEGCSTSSTTSTTTTTSSSASATTSAKNQNIVTYPLPLLPPSVTDLTSRFLHPSGASDVFVATYSKGMSVAFRALARCVEDFQFRVESVVVHSGGCDATATQGNAGGVCLVRNLLRAVRSESNSLLNLIQLDAAAFFSRHLNSIYLSIDREFDKLFKLLSTVCHLHDGTYSIAENTLSYSLSHAAAREGGGGEQSRTEEQQCLSIAEFNDVRSLILEGVQGTSQLLRDVANSLAQSSAGDDLAAAVLQSSSIVFCTLTSAGSGIVKKNVFNVDTLVVDEAAQALEVELLIPLSTTPRNLILVGDPKQLPACVLSMENQRSRRGESAMQRLMERCAYPAMLLDTQYRMHPAISLLPNRLFYESSLRDSTYVLNRKCIFNSISDHEHGSCTQNTTLRNNSARSSSRNGNVRSVSKLPGWLQNYSFIDVPSTGGLGEKGGGNLGKSLSNEAEAQVVVK